jgi:2-hydroxy-3-oxopropionate reductase
MEMITRIAVVGVGLMGSSLARHLLAAGFAVTVHDMDPAKVEAIVK